MLPKRCPRYQRDARLHLGNATKRARSQFLALIMLFAALPISGELVAGVLRGVVRDDASGEGISGAVIEVLPIGNRVKCGSAGTFQLKGLPAGTYTVRATSIGYAAAEKSVTISTESSEVTCELRLRSVALSTAEVVISARADRETDGAARLSELKAPSVITVMSAESIGRYPDASAADVAQRIPGLSITRVRGEARDAIIRGMEARYNSTLIDGVKMPSPATRNHILRLDILPSDLLQRVEITKSLTPDMEADGIGGAMNLVMRTAPDKFTLRGRLAAGYGSILFDRSLLAFRTDSVLDDPLVRNGGDYKAKPGDFTRDNLKLFSRTAPPDYLAELTIGDRMFDGRLGLIVATSLQQTYRRSETVHNYDAVDADNNLYLTRRQFREFGQDLTRYGVTAKADFIFDARNEVTASLSGFLRQNREARIQSDSNYISFPVLLIGHRSVVQTHTLGSVVVDARHKLDEWQLRWRVGYAIAGQANPDRAEFITSTALIGDQIASEPIFYAVQRDWQHNEDRDLFAGADGEWEGLRAQNITLGAGGLFRTKRRSNYQNEYRLSTVTDSHGQLPVFTSIDSVQWEVLNVGGTPEYSNNNYRCAEETAAGYLMARWTIGDLGILGGVRVEATSSDFSTWNVDRMAQLSAASSYIDVLPSVHLRYALAERSVLRLSAGRTISRANYFDLVPYNYFADDYRVMGNPALRHTRSTNIDLRYEAYLSENGQLSVGTFFKSITDPVESTLDLSNPALPTLTPRNLGTATNIGLELVGGITVFDHLRLSANYTFTNSSITSSKLQNDRASGRTITVQETRSLQGQSAHIGNLAVAYVNEGSGTTAQTSLTYTGRRIAAVSVHANLNHYQTDITMLDVSLEQRLVKSFSFLLRANNLLDAPFEIRSQSGDLIESERSGMFITVGIVYRN